MYFSAPVQAPNIDEVDTLPMATGSAVTPSPSPSQIHLSPFIESQWRLERGASTCNLGDRLDEAADCEETQLDKMDNEEDGETPEEEIPTDDDVLECVEVDVGPEGEFQDNETVQILSEDEGECLMSPSKQKPVNGDMPTTDSTRPTEGAKEDTMTAKPGSDKTKVEIVPETVQPTGDEKKDGLELKSSKLDGSVHADAPEKPTETCEVPGSKPHCAKEEGEKREEARVAGEEEEKICSEDEKDEKKTGKNKSTFKAGTSGHHKWYGTMFSVFLMLRIIYCLCMFML